MASWIPVVLIPFATQERDYVLTLFLILPVQISGLSVPEFFLPGIVMALELAHQYRIGQNVSLMVLLSTQMLGELVIGILQITLAKYGMDIFLEFLTGYHGSDSFLGLRIIPRMMITMIP
jgi:hypothetical protein